MSEGSTAVRVGTRGSLLARTQTGQIVDRLAAVHPDLSFELVVIRTSGDRDRREVVGAFVKELQEALLDGEVDLAIHSLKDLPTQRPDGLTLAAVPERQDVRDALISPLGALQDLRPGARVGMGSVRRSAQIRFRRPDLLGAPLMGNVDTRLRKLKDGDYDAILLAAAGMRRLGYDFEGGTLGDTGLFVELLSLDQMLPAPGQGALAIETRAEDTRSCSIALQIDHRPTHFAVRTERAFLEALGGGCQTPVAAHATVSHGACKLSGLVAAPDGSALLRDQLAGSDADPEELGTRLAQGLIDRGARDIMAGSHP